MDDIQLSSSSCFPSSGLPPPPGVGVGRIGGGGVTGTFGGGAPKMPALPLIPVIAIPQDSGPRTPEDCADGDDNWDYIPILILGRRGNRLGRRTSSVL
jgi:hypothetical protein